MFLCVVLIFLILMHSGKDAGLSGAFGVGTGAGPFGGGSLVERNLNRWTVGFAIAFVINTIVLIKISLAAARRRYRRRSARPTAGPAEPVDQPQQVERAERLGQEQVGAGLLGLALDAVAVGGGQHHDRRCARSAVGSRSRRQASIPFRRGMSTSRNTSVGARAGDLERLDAVGGLVQLELRRHPRAWSRSACG